MRSPDELREDVTAALERGEGGTLASRIYSDGVEALVKDAFERTGPSEGVAVLAQGGLARRELAPRADVDLLIVVEERRDELHTRVEKLLYALWDLGLVLGHAVRTPADAFDAVRADHHAATALLEARRLAGDEQLAASVRGRFFREMMPVLRERLTRDKLAEMRERRARFGGSVHLVEPNVKSSPGGLRDLHSVLWLGLVQAGPGTSPKGGALSRLLETGIVYAREAEALRGARDELLALRTSLHLVSGRSEDRLLFQHQQTLAELLRVQPQREETPTEALMRRYFRAALVVRRTADDVVERLLLEPKAPAAAVAVARDLGQGLRSARGMVFAAEPSLFERAPARMIDAIRVADEEQLRLSPRTRSRIYQALTDRKLDDDEACGQALLALCKSRHVMGTPFAELLESGVLGVVMRDFQRLDGRFKQDGYHAYTTDAHICRCTDMALRVASGAEPPPDALAPAVERTSRFHLLVLGALFHDIGKGLGGDHSQQGVDIALLEAKRMGLPPGEREILRFLVEEHLTLSWASQRRDLTDPAVIEDVARRVLTAERLDLLALLTWVDISSVAPGMMTDWKGRLLGLAVERVRAYLLEPNESGAVRGEHEAEVRRRASASLAGVTDEDSLARFIEGASVRAIASRLEDELVEDLAAFAAYDPEKQDPIVACSLAEGGHAHTLRVVAPDRRGLLGDVARALASHGANVLHAHADSRDDGIGFDAFRVDDGRGRALQHEALAHAVEALYDAGKGDLDRASPTSLKPARRTGPRIEPRVRVIADGDTWGATIVELRAEDRPGLVADLARTFASLAWNIVLAKINTEGTVARDAFYVMRDSADDDASRPALEELREALLLCLKRERPA